VAVWIIWEVCSTKCLRLASNLHSTFIDFLLRVSHLDAGEYIDDTEDLVNINLDNSRNKLIRFEILLTTGTFALSSYS